MMPINLILATDVYLLRCIFSYWNLPSPQVTTFSFKSMNSGGQMEKVLGYFELYFIKHCRKLWHFHPCFSTNLEFPRLSVPVLFCYINTENKSDLRNPLLIAEVFGIEQVITTVILVSHPLYHDFFNLFIVSLYFIFLHPILCQKLLKYFKAF